uniref:Cation efflux protein transmembrane domain-containing protein n=1 Tax=Lotharella globosa TaxID=91324 RepID=A0A7S4DS26_9EUKA
MAAPFPELSASAAQEIEITLDAHPTTSSKNRRVAMPQSSPLISRLKSFEASKFGGVAKKGKLAGYFRMLWSYSESRRLMAFIGISGSFSTLQLIFAAVTGSIELMSAALHNYFHCTVLMCSLLAMGISVESKDKGYTYGYDRCNVLAAFTNGVFLVLMALFFITEAIHHLTSEHHVHTDPSMTLLLTGLGVDLLGLWLFLPYARLSVPTVKTQASRTFSEAHKVNLHSVFLHVLADNLRTIGFLVTTIASRYVGDSEEFFPAFVTLVVAMLIIRSVWPLVSATCEIILQAAPMPLLAGVQKCMREVISYDGVLRCKSQHWWVFAPGITVGTLTLLVRHDADSQAVLAHAHSLLKKYVTHITIQVEKQPNPYGQQQQQQHKQQHGSSTGS